jgi:hypothetical protein
LVSRCSPNGMTRPIGVANAFLPLHGLDRPDLGRSGIGTNEQP